MKLVNLARRPFENLRPVRRLTGLMWVLGIGFLAINLWLFWGHLTGFSATRGQLADVRAAIATESEKLDRVEADVAALALEGQNETVTNLNELIEKRVFPWSLLFDRLEGVLPNDIRLQGVRPENQEVKIQTRQKTTRGSSRRRRERPASRPKREEPTGVVAVGLTGVARTEEALLELVDALWDDPTFDSPTLKGERRNQTNEIDFSLDVRFRTTVAANLASQEGAETAPEVAPPVVASDAREAVIPGTEVPTAVAAVPTTPTQPTATTAPATAVPMALPRAAANEKAAAADERAAAAVRLIERVAAQGRVSSSGRAPRTRLSDGRGTGENPSQRRTTTGSTREGRPTTTTASPHATPQVPGVVVLPGARPAAAAPISAVPTAAPSPRPANPANSRPPRGRASQDPVPQDPVPQQPVPQQPGSQDPAPQQPTPTPDPDTPAPPDPNASAGASLAGGAP